MVCEGGKSTMGWVEEEEEKGGEGTMTTTCCDGWVLPTAAWLTHRSMGGSHHHVQPHSATRDQPQLRSHTPQDPSLWWGAQQSQERWLESVSLLLPPMGSQLKGRGEAVSVTERFNNGQNGQCHTGNNTVFLTLR